MMVLLKIPAVAPLMAILTLFLFEFYVCKIYRMQKYIDPLLVTLLMESMYLLYTTLTVCSY